ncbi:MAG: type II secretion system protein, partial [Tepidisphaeraceae bacterium]
MNRTGDKILLFASRGPSKGLRSRGRGSAFTLVELVIAMAMVAFVALALYKSLKAAFDLTASADRVVEPARTAEIAMEILSEDLQNAVAPNAANNAPAVTIPTTAENISDLTGITGAGSTSSTTSSTTGGTTGGGASASSSSTSTTTTWLLAGPFEGTQNQAGGGEA